VERSLSGVGVHALLAELSIFDLVTSHYDAEKKVIDWVSDACFGV